MSVPLSGNAQSLVGEHPAAGIAELAAELNAKEFIVVDELWVDNATREVSNNGPVIVGRRSERS